MLMAVPLVKLSTSTLQVLFYCYNEYVETQGRGEQQSDALRCTLWKTALYVWRPLVLTVTHPL